MRIFRRLEEIPEIDKAVITIGSFDGVHRGHQKIISRITQLAKEIDGESVIITFDPHPRSVVYPKDKTLNLLNTLDEKIMLLEELGVDNLVIVPFTIEFSQQHPREYIEKFLLKYFNPAYIAIGYDHRFGLNREGNIDLLKDYEEAYDFKVIRIEKQEIEENTISSTNIRKAVANAEMSTAQKYLNNYYLLSGKVAFGQQIGKELGFPTANIEIKEKSKLIPPDGVYAVYVTYAGKRFDGMLYIGTRPTLGGKQERRIEVNIFDFNEIIYGEFLVLELVMFIRDDMRFENLQKLKTQLHDDEVQTKLILEKITQREEPVKKKCTIAILNYNGEEYLESYLPSISFSSTQDLDVWIIDNNSTDDSANYIEEWHPEIKLVQFSKNYGFAEGYNKAVKNISTKYTVLLNNDVLVTENWLDPIIELMEADDTIAAVQPKIRSLSEPKYFEHAGAAGGYLDSLAYAFCKGRMFNEVEEDLGQYDKNEEVFWASGAAMVVRTQAFNELGGFDNSYFAHYEEIDLCWRFKRAGYKIMSYNESVVYHLGGGTLPYESSKKLYLNFRNSLKTYLKNESGPFKLPKFLLRLILDGGAALMLFLQGKWDAIPIIIKAHWSVFWNLGKVYRMKRKFDHLIKLNKIGPENKNGRFKGIIPIHYYLFSKKKYSDLK